MAIVLSGTALSTDLARIRGKSTDIEVFRGAVHRIGLHLAAETLRHLPAKAVEVETPLETTSCDVVEGAVVLVPILRAGLGLLNPFLEILPSASVGFIGLKRNEETLEPYEYYHNLPPTTDSTTFVVIDPMLATGGSMLATLKHLQGLPHQRILASCLIAAPEGVTRVEDEFPNIGLVVAALDRELNSSGYILPGLGDAGDRLFGTI